MAGIRDKVIWAFTGGLIAIVCWFVTINMYWIRVLDQGMRRELPSRLTVAEVADLAGMESDRRGTVRLVKVPDGTVPPSGWRRCNGDSLEVYGKLPAIGDAVLAGDSLIMPEAQSGMSLHSLVPWYRLEFWVWVGK